jgi:hypothetical protein
MNPRPTLTTRLPPPLHLSDNIQLLPEPPRLYIMPSGADAKAGLKTFGGVGPEGEIVFQVLAARS